MQSMGRYRKSVIEERARESQRLHKVLEDAGVKLSSVASSVLTKSGREMIDALIGGQRDPEALAEMAKGRMRSKIPQLRDAMAGRFNEHHALLCQAMLARIDQADATVEVLGARIEELLGPYEAAVTLLVTIPGVAHRSAQVILAEIGADMSRFPTAGHLASWAGMCPGNNESAGKHRSGRTRAPVHAIRWEVLLMSFLFFWLGPTRASVQQVLQNHSFRFAKAPGGGALIGPPTFTVL